jgi:hypothetical protein
MGVAVGFGVAVGEGVGVGVGPTPPFRITLCPLMEKFVGVCGGVPLKVNPMVADPPLAARTDVQLAGVKV